MSAPHRNRQETRVRAAEMEKISRATREAKRLQQSHGFDVADKWQQRRRSRTRNSQLHEEEAQPPPPPPINEGDPNFETPVKKTKKASNPYKGPSGPFSRKPNWSNKKKAKHRRETGQMMDVEVEEHEDEDDVMHVHARPLTKTTIDDVFQHLLATARRAGQAGGVEG